MSEIQVDEEAIKEFRLEAYEMLDTAEENLLALDQNRDFIANYDSLFRVFHSLKGAAGMVGLEQLKTHMHELENHLQTLKEKQILDKPEIDYFLRGVDASRKLLKGERVSFDYGLRKESNISHKITLRPNNKKVFLIDDEPDLLEIMAEFLVDSGFETLLFSDPEKAAIAIKEMRPPVILTDMIMPKLSGLDILKQAHLVDPDISVIYVSGMLKKETLIESMSHGIYGVIEKPFNHSQILSSCISGYNRYRTLKLLNRSINLLIYQYSDLDKALELAGKSDERKVLKSNISDLIEQKRELKKSKPDFNTAQGQNV
jgi:FixJ family two-component response regulator/HPt (histidine-containing phosphotransfer) domain-containing protein